MRRNKNLNFALMAVAVVFCLISFVFEANAQKRRRTTRKPAAAASTKPSVSSAELKEGAQKVSTQIKNVSKFVYIFGGVAKNYGSLNADARAKAKPAIVESIRNLQAGLAALEEDFRAKPSLKIYAPWVEGVSGLSANAAEQANAGQMEESGNTLLMVVEKLTDALAALP